MTAKAPLRRDIADEVTARVLDGRLGPGSRVNEVRLAAELGVSRTPLREALVALADRALLISAPGRGFLVPELDRAEAHRLYQLIAELEALAVRWTTLPELAALTDALDECADAMAGDDPSTVDERWHALLLSRCANPHLVRLVEQTKPLIKRYEIAYFRSVAGTSRSIEEHRAIAAALRAGDLSAATDLLVRNWVRTAEHEEGAR
ncbi:GntR family transcriptional regulator [Amycolatopsis sp. CA-230715]|uniref:GntR family transcriptional regulator n=1 Tax=Amycolatopsis sp. CA-230715 TaxID=2745196 RepID=UPI0020B3B4AF|nr:GntR family transcriptional regulator [Amycolatopsis sp. CA-230715]